MSLYELMSLPIQVSNCGAPNVKFTLVLCVCSTENNDAIVVVVVVVALYRIYSLTNLICIGSCKQLLEVHDV